MAFTPDCGIGQPPDPKLWNRSEDRLDSLFVRRSCHRSGLLLSLLPDPGRLVINQAAPDQAERGDKSGSRKVTESNPRLCSLLLNRSPTLIPRI